MRLATARVLARCVAFVLLPCLFTNVAPRALCAFRPPSVPLVTHDPYFSIWSPADRLTDAATVHWTGRAQAMRSLVRIDGRVYRLMGSDPADAPALPQVSLEVRPTRTVYRFQGAGVSLALTFLSPMLPEDLDTLSRPVTYLTWRARASDGRSHRVALYFDAGCEIAVNTPRQAVRWGRARVPGLQAMRCGTVEQPILVARGDDVRIDWGYLYVAAPDARGVATAIGDGEALRRAFAEQGALPRRDDPDMPRRADDRGVVLAAAFAATPVDARPVTRQAMVAYDDRRSILYFGEMLRPYWRRAGMDAEGLLRSARTDYPALEARSRAFDERLLAALRAAGGETYARIGALLYRQCIAANKLAADARGMPLLFPKENFSNGCIATVDVIYPMSPLFLLMGSALSRAMLVPVLDYAASPRWRFPFAPHDLGTYPHATGQVYGGGERSEENQMPVEESANMILMVAALSRAEGSPAFARRYWALIGRWADYLRRKGMDPENQLCTDDFAGHLAHNANLSVKAILALGAYAGLCRQTGRAREGARYAALARAYAARWARMATEGDHTLLAFDRPGTWSQKYNLVWDHLLALGLFPPSVARREVAFCLRAQNRYGLPLDSRKAWTKLDWSVWSASLADRQADFEALLRPVEAFLNATPQRVPATDFYWTDRPDQAGMQARPVVGGAFIRLMNDPAGWRAWFARGARVTASWAPQPTPAPVVRALAAADTLAAPWRYTLERPAENWARPAFDDSGWREGLSGFGAPGTPGARIGTTWTTRDIWLRRRFTLGAAMPREPRLWIHHDEDAEVFVNGVPAARLGGYTVDYVRAPMSLPARRALRAGENVLAVHCRQTAGGQYIDVGIAAIPASTGAAGTAGSSRRRQSTGRR